MREWLTVIIACLIIGVLLDGLRRMRAAKRGDMRMSLSMHKGVTKEELEAYGSELPNGGARVVSKRDVQTPQGKAVKSPAVGKKAPVIKESPGLKASRQQSAPQSTAQPPEPAETAAPVRHKQPVPGAGKHAPAAQQQLDLDQQVPLLMDVDDSEPLVASRREPSIADLPDLNGAAIDEDAYDRVLFSKNADVSDPYGEPTLAEDPAPDEVFVVNVVAPKGEVFVGAAVKDAILGAGLRFGSHRIFHHHQDENGEGPVQFSLVNMVKPGVFDLNKFDELETPGLSLFMTLPSEADNIKAYDALIASARRIADELGGELRDDQHSTLTHQTIEHNRARVSEYQRKRQLDKVRI